MVYNSLNFSKNDEQIEDVLSATSSLFKTPLYFLHLMISIVMKIRYQSLLAVIETQIKCPVTSENVVE